MRPLSYTGAIINSSSAPGGRDALLHPRLNSGVAYAGEEIPPSHSGSSPSTGLPEMLATDGAGGHSAIQGPCRYRRSDLQVSAMRALGKLDR